MIISNEFDSDKNYGIAFYSQSPQKRIIKVNRLKRLERMSQDRIDYFDFKINENNVGNFFLSFPKINFIIIYDRTYHSINKYRYSLINFGIAFSDLNNEELYIPSLYNVDEECNICTSQRDYGAWSLEDLFDQSIKDFWSSEFIMPELSDNVNLYKTRILGNYEKWQKKTKENPNWIPSKREMIRLPDRVKSSLKL